MEKLMTPQELEDILKYQDFVEGILYDIGLPIGLYRSKKWNIEKGESRAGVEIKNDKRFAETGNLYFETYERRDKNGFWVESGLNRDDNTIMIFIGDYDRGWLFSKNILKAICQKDCFKRVETDTSKGVLIPIEYFEKNPLLVMREFCFKKV